jgi:hypothetical protein
MCTPMSLCPLPNNPFYFEYSIRVFATPVSSPLAKFYRFYPDKNDGPELFALYHTTKRALSDNRAALSYT